VEFPLTLENQEQLDALIKTRLERARAEQSQRIAELEAAVEEAQAAGYQRILQRDARNLLGSMNVATSRHERIMRLAELGDVAKTEDGEPDIRTLERKFKELYKEMPEVFGPDAKVEEVGLDTSGRNGGADELTREKIESMSPDEVNSNWDRVKAFLAGER